VKAMAATPLACVRTMRGAAAVRSELDQVLSLLLRAKRCTKIIAILPHRSHGQPQYDIGSPTYRTRQYQPEGAEAASNTTNAR
jgi:hypothetical protein